MKAFVALILIATSAPAAMAANASLLAKTGKALEEQLACLNPPQPGLAIRTMLANGVITRTKFAADGSPVFAPTDAIYVYGSRVTFITGWESEVGKVKPPFWRGPGTAPPVFLAVTLEKSPAAIHYTPRGVRGADVVVQGAFSSIEPANEYYTHTGTTITCYGG